MDKYQHEVEPDSPLAIAMHRMEAWDEAPPELADLLAKLLMCFHDFDRRVADQVYQEHGHWMGTDGMSRNNGGPFRHVQFLMRLP